MCSGWRMPGTPAAATTIGAAAGVLRPVGHAGVHDRDGGVGGRALRATAAATAGGPSVNPRPSTTTSRPGDRDLVVREQRLDPGRRARQRTVHAEGEAAHVERVLAVGVLVGVELGERRLVVDVRRGRVLDEHGVDVVVGVERADRRRRRRPGVASSGRCDVRARRSRARRRAPASCGCSRRTPSRRRRGSCRGRGCGPAARSASTRAARSANTASATGLPGHHHGGITAVPSADCLAPARRRATSRLLRPVHPADGRLGVLIVGLGAVSSTLIAGVELVEARPRRADRLARPDGHDPPGQAHRRPQPDDQGLRAARRRSTTSCSGRGTRSPTMPTSPPSGPVCSRPASTSSRSPTPCATCDR